MDPVVEYPPAGSKNWTRAMGRSHLLQNYTNPLSQIGFNGIEKIRKFYGGKLTKKEVEDLLSTFESYSLMRQEKTRKKDVYEGYSLVTHLYNVFEVDSFQINEMEQDNDGFCHIFCALNIFSKRLFAVPMVTRSSKSGLSAIQTIFELLGRYPDNLVSDEGGECTSKSINKFLRSKGTNCVIARGEHKAAGVERVQGTLQRKIYSYLNSYQSRRYIDILPDLVHGYNCSKHSTTGFSPYEVEDSMLVQSAVLDKYIKKAIFTRGKRRQIQKYQIGQTVRVQKKRSKFSRGYDVQTNDQRYIIHSVDKTRPHNLYFLKDERGKKLSGGGFRQSELVPIRLTDEYRSKTVRKFKKGKQHFAEVEFIGYDPSWNEIVKTDA